MKQKQPTRLQIIRRVLAVSFQRPFCMTLSVLLSVLSALSYFVPYFCAYKLIALCLQGGAEGLTANVLHYGALALSGAVLHVVTYFLAGMLSHLAAFDTSYDLKMLLARKFAALPMGFHTHSECGKKYAVMGSGIDGIQSFIAHKLPDMVSSVCYPACMVLMILLVDPLFGAALLFDILIAYVFHYLSMGRGGAKHMMDLYYGALDEMENASVECVRGLTVLKTFGKKAGPFRKFMDSVSDYTNMVIPYTRNWEKHMCFFVALLTNSYLFLLPVAFWKISHTTDYREFALHFLFYLILAPSMASIISKTGRIMEEFMRVFEEIERMDEFLFQEDQKFGAVDQVPEDTTIRFSNVCFSYEEEKGRGKTVHALNGVSFTAKEGTLTGIVGPSGSGKSTILSLLFGFYEQTSGEITIGGRNIREFSYPVLMRMISYVQPGEILFSSSVFDNIRLGKPDATDEEVQNAAKLANCHDVIAALPEGYDTILNEDSVKLSVGQRQRIALARAFLKDAPIILLDEATSSQDPENERLITEALSRLVKQKTVIMVAHRLTTVKNADHILVLKDGKICEEGVHETLLKNGGLYSSLWASYEEVLNWHIKQ